MKAVARMRRSEPPFSLCRESSDRGVAWIVNLRKIAEIAGTSHTTVSRALNGSPLVADATRERIIGIAREMGYQLDAGARSLSTGVRMTIGLLYSFHADRQLESMYTAQLMHLISGSLAGRGFDTMIEGFDIDTDDTAKILRMVRQKKADGVLIIGYEVSEGLAEEIHTVTDKCVFINPAYAPWVERYPAVLVDHRRGGRLAAEVLIERGCTRLATISEDDPQFRVRVEGFAAEAARHELKLDPEYDRFLVGDGTYETAYSFGVEHFDTLRRFDGLFVGSDVSAIGVMNALLDYGVRIPSDIALIGYDDVEWSGYLRPALTTIHQPKAEIAEAAAEEIVRRVLGEGESELTETLNPVLVRRSSA